jgi:hypothetical protein
MLTAKIPPYRHRAATPSRDWISGRQHGPESSYPEAMLRFYYSNVPPTLQRKRDGELHALEEAEANKLYAAPLTLPTRLRALARSERNKEER